MTRRLPALLGGVLLVAGCNVFTGEIPVGSGIPEVSYISPRDRNGIQDRLVLPVDVDKPYETMVVGGYRFTVTAASGEKIHTTEVAVVPQGTKAATAVEGVPIPESLSWDGTTSSGDWAADGAYTWSVDVWDTKGNSGHTPALTVIVDNTPPFLTLEVPELVISPNGDAVLDTLAVTQTGSTTEDQWVGEIRTDMGHVMRTFRWTGQAVSFAWDGLDETGTRAEDGTYVYSVSSRDRAGSSGTFTVGGITVDTDPAGVGLGVTSSWLSPNGDGVRDIVQFLPRAARAGTVTAWTIALRDGAGVTKRRFSGAGNAPDRVEFDGKDDTGRPLPDGTYTARLTVTYPNGATPGADSTPVSIDTVAPRIQVTVDGPVFSPDGDGNRDSVTLGQISSTEERWNGRVTDATGRVVLTKSWEGVAPTFTWDGKDDAGWSLPDGSYVYHVESIDAAGNGAAQTVNTLFLDRRPAAVTLGSTVAAFSPNGDGVLDTVDFTMSAKPADGIADWALTIRDTQGRVAIAFGAPAPEELPTWIQWDGRRASGGVAEGAMKAELVVRYTRGSTARVSLDLTVDLTPPQLTAEVSPRPFSPDDDGIDDTLTIRLGARDTSGLGEWTARLLDPEGRLFQQWRGSGTPAAPLVWDGRSPAGELVQSAADYQLVVRGTDGAGNAASVSVPVPVDILVIREGERLRIVISSIYFKEDTADFRDVPEDRARSNLRTLDKLAERLKTLSQHTIRVEGHGVSVFWDDPVRSRAEEDSVLQPLSLARARAVLEALVERGIPAPRLSAVGFGGSQPVAPHGDLVNRWKNRRVEFVLERS